MAIAVRTLTGAEIAAALEGGRLPNVRLIGTAHPLRTGFWVRKSSDMRTMADLKGKRIAVGRDDSGTRVLALSLLKANGVEPGGATALLDLDERGRLLKNLGDNQAMMLRNHGLLTLGDTVREAFDLLVSTGLAERVAYRGVRVRETAIKDIVEAYGLRLHLEVIIAEEVARHITPEQVAGLERTIVEMKKHDNLKDVSLQRRLSREFHAAIAEATRNDLLIKLYGIVSNAFPDWLLYEALFRYPEILQDSMTSMHTEHIAIVEAFKKGDGLKAALRSVEHVMESGQWLVDYLDIPAALLREKEEQVLSLLKKSK